MDWPEIFKNFAIYGTISALIFGFILYLKIKKSNLTRISHSATMSRANYLLLASGITISAGLLAFCVYGYMIHATTIPSLFYWLFGLVLICLLILAWVPATKGTSYKVHYWAAWIKTFILSAVIALMYVESNENSANGVEVGSNQLQLVGFLFVVIFVVAATYTNQPNLSSKKSLYSQQFIYVLFLGAVLVRIYLV